MTWVSTSFWGLVHLIVLFWHLIHDLLRIVTQDGCGFDIKPKGKPKPLFKRQTEHQTETENIILAFFSFFLQIKHFALHYPCLYCIICMFYKECKDNMSLKQNAICKNGALHTSRLNLKGTAFFIILYCINRSLWLHGRTSVVAFLECMWIWILSLICFIRCISITTVLFAGSVCLFGGIWNFFFYFRGAECHTATFRTAPSKNQS